MTTQYQHSHTMTSRQQGKTFAAQQSEAYDAFHTAFTAAVQLSRDDGPAQLLHYIIKTIERKEGTQGAAHQLSKALRATPFRLEQHEHA